MCVDALVRGANVVQTNCVCAVIALDHVCTLVLCMCVCEEVVGRAANFRACALPSPRVQYARTRSARVFACALVLMSAPFVLSKA